MASWQGGNACARMATLNHGGIIAHTYAKQRRDAGDSTVKHTEHGFRIDLTSKSCSDTRFVYRCYHEIRHDRDAKQVKTSGVGGRGLRPAPARRGAPRPGARSLPTRRRSTRPRRRPGAAAAVRSSERHS